MILVIGGRSKIGSALIEELVSLGEHVRALVRKSEGVDSFAAAVETIVGDLGDPGSLHRAMQGVDKVFLLCGPTRDEVALNKNAIEAAESAGVELLVRSSILGSDPASNATFVADHGVCDAYLRDSEVAHAIVHPNLFMQNVPETTIPSIDADGNFYANAGEARISMVDTRDVASVAAVLLTQPGHESSEHDVTGPEALSYADVASKLSVAMGRQVNYVNVPDDAVRVALSGFGLGEWMAESLVNLYEDYRRAGANGYAAEVTDTVARLVGRQARTLDQLLAEQRGGPAVP
jgi:uncharacterized protein YbjT (DUF2867 family)